jgi:hypothetical protein
VATSGVAIGLALVIWTWSRAAAMSTDGAHYMELAQRAWRHGPAAGMDWYSGPGYPVAVAWLYGLFGDLEFSGRLTSVLFGCGFVAGVGLLARQMFGPVVAGVAVGLVAVHTSLVRHSVMAETDVAYGCWLMWSLVCVWRLRHSSGFIGQSAHAVAAGLALGLGYLTRPEAAPLAGLLVGWYAFAVWVACRQLGVGMPPPSRGHGTRVAGRLGWALVVVAIGLAVAAPYVLKLRDELGRWSLSGKERCFAMKYAADRQDDAAIRNQSVLAAVFDRPSNLVRWLPHHLHYGVPVFGKSLHVVVVGLAAIGLARRRVVDRSPGAVGLLLWSSVPFLLFFGLTYPRPRYFMQALGPWVVLAAVGVVELAAWASELRVGLAVRWRSATPDAAGRRALAIALAAPMFILAASTFWSLRRPLEQGLATERAVGERILQLAGPGRRVLTFTVPAFYAEAERVPLWGPMEGIVRCHGFSKPLTYEELVDHVRRRHAEYIIMDHDLQRDCPDFLARVRDEDFQLVIADVADDHGPHLVYQFVGARLEAARAN